MLIDQAVSHFSGGRTSYDDRGAIAARAGICKPLLDWLESHPYFARGWPKTTGREDFGDAYFRLVLDQARSFEATAEETIATLTACTACTIADAVPPSFKRVIVSGGGAFNETMMAGLRAALGVAAGRFALRRLRHTARCKGSARIRGARLSDGARALR
jgi:anhydro-N-acetylmuramic acid kinase